MLTEDTIKSLVSGLVAGGCHNGINEDSHIVAPYVVFHEISGVPLNTISAYSGRTKCRFQIDVFARSPEQAKGLALGVIKAAIEGDEILQGSMIFQMSGQYSALDKTHQYITEYIIWTD